MKKRKLKQMVREQQVEIAALGGRVKHLEQRALMQHAHIENLIERAAWLEQRWAEDTDPTPAEGVQQPWVPTHRSTADGSTVRQVGKEGNLTMLVENECGERFNVLIEHWEPIPEEDLIG